MKVSNGQNLKPAEKAILVLMGTPALSLIGYFISRTGFRSYIFILTIMATVWIGGIYLGFKRKVMLGRGLEINKDKTPGEFYVNIGVLLLLYLVMLIFFVGMFQQEIGNLKRS